MVSVRGYLNRRSRPKDPVVVIGLGRFGFTVAQQLQCDGIEILGIDKSTAVVDALGGKLTHIVAADSTDEEALRRLGVDEASQVVIGLGSAIEDSILTASLLVDMNIHEIYAKAVTDSHARILTQLGVSRIIRPEYDSGRRLAHRLGSVMVDFTEIEGYALAVATVPQSFAAKTVAELHIRDRYRITLVAQQDKNGKYQSILLSTELIPGRNMIIGGAATDLDRYCRMISNEFK